MAEELGYDWNRRVLRDEIADSKVCFLFNWDRSCCNCLVSSSSDNNEEGFDVVDVMVIE